MANLKPPLRSELARVFKDQRTLRAFEQLFDYLPNIEDLDQDAIEAAQITADSAQAQALIAIALITAINQLVSLKTQEPVAQQFNSNQSELCELAPRHEYINDENIYPIYQQLGYQNLNLEVT